VIIFFGEGRLGNQLFQYAFLKNFAKKGELIFTNNFSELLELFDIQDNIINIRNKHLVFITKKILVVFLKKLARLRVISYCQANKEKINNLTREKDSYKFLRGLFPIIFIFPGYFQSENFFDKKNLANLKIKSKYKNRAKAILSKAPKNRQKIFVHIRRKDYKKINHHFLGKHYFSLPLTYYKNSFNYLSKRIKNPYYIFFSDDIDFVKENFKKITPGFISENSMFIDFTMMTLCNGGIASNSSFSWWASYFMKKKKFVLVPKYWLGFNNKLVHPIGIYPNFSKIINFKNG
jgi:hypothetical protein